MRVHRVLWAICLLAVPAAAQDTMHHRGGTADAMQDALQQMQHGMDVPATGDAEVDFARMMIPHHQGAVAMAKAELADGKDPALRKLAEEIIVAQEREITFLQEWLAERGIQP
jgi:uncharacterized protein (DUF305 family)